MDKVRIGDIVGRKSYGSDVLFKVVDIKKDKNEKVIVLKGITYRLKADAPESDLEIQTNKKVRNYKHKSNFLAQKKSRDIRMSRMATNTKKRFFRDTSKEKTRTFKIPGKVLHIDGDEDYLKTCEDKYRELGVNVTGKHVNEEQQPDNVYSLLQKYKPDILVLTGHDGVIKSNKEYMNIENYYNSKYYIEAVKQARKFEDDIDRLIIWAGACQSFYSEIIKAGANYASSPARVLIHALDPVLVCQKIAFTGIGRVVQPREVIDSSLTGIKGIGGVQTRGKYRNGYPDEQV